MYFIANIRFFRLVTTRRNTFQNFEIQKKVSKTVRAPWPNIIIKLRLKNFKLFWNTIFLIKIWSNEIRKRCGIESVQNALKTCGHIFPQKVAKVDLLTSKIKKDLKSKIFQSKDWRNDRLCPYLEEIQDTIFDFVQITTFRCRKSGYKNPCKVKNL